ncbi:hypothetical protein BGZ46_007096 [Entomortierella lignicola]|nr:hypothetical protein BGZ46_007096 [Entomortierella lignicola]
MSTSVTVPLFSNGCIAPDRSGSAVWLVGVSPASEGNLQAYSINLLNISSPTAILIGNQTANGFWSSTAPKACFNYPGNTANPSSPIMIQQFMPLSYFANIYPNGSMSDPLNVPGRGFVSPKTYSLSGAVGNLNWFTTMVNYTYVDTGSPWSSLRLNATEGLNSSQDFLLSQYPTSTPLVSVGTYVPSSNTPAQGYTVVFDGNGGGKIYIATSSASPINTDLDRVMTLTYIQDVDMNGNTLSTQSIPLTMIGVGYFLDMAPDGSTVLYSINPGQSPKLQRVSIQGSVPPFSPSMAATVMNTQIITYGASSSGAATTTFNAFDTVAGSWSGPGLVAAYVPSTTSKGISQPSPTNGGDSGNGSSKSSSTPIGAIVGGIVGGLVVIALIAFFFVRRNRRNSTKAAALSANNVNNGVTPQLQQNMVPVQQPLAQNQYQPQLQQQYNPNQQFGQVNYSPSNVVASQQQPPVIFQSQQHGVDQSQRPYSYVPPTLTALPQQQQQPSIFQPQVDGTSNGSYNQGVYSPSTATPQTPYTPLSQAHSPGSSASPQYSGNIIHQGYV